MNGMGFGYFGGFVVASDFLPTNHLVPPCFVLQPPPSTSNTIGVSPCLSPPSVHWPKRQGSANAFLEQRAFFACYRADNELCFVF